MKRSVCSQHHDGLDWTPQEYRENIEKVVKLIGSFEPAWILKMASYRQGSKTWNVSLLGQALKHIANRVQCLQVVQALIAANVDPKEVAHQEAELGGITSKTGLELAAERKDEELSKVLVEAADKMALERKAAAVKKEAPSSEKSDAKTNK